MEEQAVMCASPLGCFKEAYRQGLIAFDEIWINLTKTRNQTVHTYEQRLAEEVYNSLPPALEAFKSLLTAVDQPAQSMAR